jgi:phospholipid/cholesterol/gamma-HCH transport system substrate-binding protein
MRFKNEVLVGVVVLVGLIILVAAAIWLSGKPWGEPQMQLVGVFREVGELREGNPVVYRGVGIGRVTKIRLSSGGDGVLVNMEVKPGIKFPADAGVLLAPASLFGDWQAEIVSRSTPMDLEFVSTGEPGVLPGATLPDISQLTAVAARIASDIERLSDRVDIAFNEESARKIAQTISNVQEITEQMTGFVDAQAHTFDAVAKNALASSENIRQTTTRVDQMVGKVETAVNAGDIQAILANARVASENLRVLSEQLQGATTGVPGLMARADTTLGAVHSLVTGLQPQLGELGPTLVEARAAMTTLRKAAEMIQQGDGTLGRLIADPALYEETQRAIATLRRILADVQANPGKYIGEVRVF